MGGGVGRLGAGGRVLELHLQAAGQARAPAAPAPAAAAAAADQRHLPHVQVRARLLGVLLPQRRCVLHRGDIGQPDLQLRVPERVRGPALRVQGPGRLVRVYESAAHDGDSVDRGRRDRRRVPRHSSLLRRVGAAAPARQDAAVLGGARPGAAGGRGGAARPGRAVQGARAARARAAGPAPLAPLLWTFAGLFVPCLYCMSCTYYR